MNNDIEIHISGHFDIDGEDWHEGWTGDDYRAHGFEENKYFSIAGETVMDGITYQTVGGRIGLTTCYRNNLLIFHSTENNKSFQFNNECGIYEYMSVPGKVNGKYAKYCHDFHYNGNTKLVRWFDGGDLISEKEIKYANYYENDGIQTKKIYFDDDGAMIKYLKYRDDISYEIVKNPNMDKSIYLDYEEEIFHFGKNRSHDFIFNHYIYETNADESYFPNTDNSSSVGISDDDDSSSGSSDPFSL